MSTMNTMPHTAVQQLIEQRLDAIDQALLGLLPRQDRLAAIAQVETRIREIAASSPATAAQLDVSPRALTFAGSAISNMTMEPLAFPSQPQFFGLGLGGQVPSTQKKRSRLAIAAAVLGIVAIGLLFMIPVSYFVVMALSEVLGEVVAIGLLGTHAVALAMGGMAAIGLSLAALVNLHRRKEQLVGHGWAIAGLCAGSVPMIMGFAAVLFVGLEMGLADLFMTTQVSVASHSSPSTDSDSADDERPVRVYGEPIEGSQPGEPVEGLPPMVQTVVHKAPHTTVRPTPAEAGNVVPTTPNCPSGPSEHELAPRAAQPSVANPEPAPRQDLPAEPGSSPESAPAIST